MAEQIQSWPNAVPPISAPMPTTNEFNVERPQCGHPFKVRAFMHNGAIPEHESNRLKQAIKDSQCEQCIQERKKEKEKNNVQV